MGGYGRGDLSPGSDLDLLIHQFEGSAAEVAERIWYPIWDTGMKLGHAVRTIDEALDLASGDLDTATSLLQVRSLGGSQALVDELQRKRSISGARTPIGCSTSSTCASAAP